MWGLLVLAPGEEKGTFKTCTLHRVTLYKVIATVGDIEETDITWPDANSNGKFGAYKWIKHPWKSGGVQSQRISGHSEMLLPPS